MAARNKNRGATPQNTPGVAPPGPPGANTQQVGDAQPTGIDAEADWVFVRAESAALSPDMLEHPSVTVREAAILGMTVARRVQSPAERAEFEKLIATKLLDANDYTKLPRYAGALLYVRAMLDRAPTASAALVPAELVAEGDTLRQRMVKVLGFYFGEGTRVGDALAKIRPGSGYTDLVGDLVTLATHYHEQRTRIERTPEFYFATDEADARRVAGEIVGHLSATDDTPTWTDAQQRIWTLFRRAYDEVAEAGRYLFRKDADVDERFPSLHSLNVAARQSAAKPTEPRPDPAKPAEPRPDPAKPAEPRPDPAKPEPA